MKIFPVGATFACLSLIVRDVQGYGSKLRRVLEDSTCDVSTPGIVQIDSFFITGLSRTSLLGSAVSTLFSLARFVGRLSLRIPMKLLFQPPRHATQASPRSICKLDSSLSRSMVLVIGQPRAQFRLRSPLTELQFDERSFWPQLLRLIKMLPLKFRMAK